MAHKKYETDQENLIKKATLESKGVKEKKPLSVEAQKMAVQVATGIRESVRMK
jgi:hypothetical protein